MKIYSEKVFKKLDRDINLLTQSIHLWGKILNDDDAFFNSKCSLCTEYRKDIDNNDCLECPIYLKTKKVCCIDTPYSDACSEFLSQKDSENPDTRKRNSMLLFLIELKNELCKNRLENERRKEIMMFQKHTPEVQKWVTVQDNSNRHTIKCKLGEDYVRGSYKCLGCCIQLKCEKKSKQILYPVNTIFTVVFRNGATTDLKLLGIIDGLVNCSPDISMYNFFVLLDMTTCTVFGNFKEKEFTKGATIERIEKFVDIREVYAAQVP
jgi:hypothetical protein